MEDEYLGCTGLGHKCLDCISFWCQYIKPQSHTPTVRFYLFIYLHLHSSSTSCNIQPPALFFGSFCRIEHTQLLIHFYRNNSHPRGELPFHNYSCFPCNHTFSFHSKSNPLGSLLYSVARRKIRFC